MHDNDETRCELPTPRETTRLMTESSLDISVDDLPAPAGTVSITRATARHVRLEAAELVERLRYLLYAVEAQVVSLGRELVAMSTADARPSQTAFHLVTTSISHARSALRGVDRFEVAIGAERVRRTPQPVPTGG
jgi:hypothetical protein